MALIISNGNRLCSNRSSVNFFCAALRYASISYCVIDFLCTCFLRVLWLGASSSFSLFMLWASSRGDHLGVTGCYTLRGGTTLGGVGIGDIVGVVRDVPLGCWKGSWGEENMPGISNPEPIFVLVRPALFCSVLAVQLVGSVAEYLYVSIPA